MGNTCCSCLQRKQSVDDLVDGSLEDKLLGQVDDGPDEARAGEEAWRRRREEVQEEEEMTMNDDERGSRTSFGRDANDWHKAATLQKDASEFVDDDEDNEAFGSAEESGAEDEEFQETSEEGPFGEEYRLTQLTSRDSYASNCSAFRAEDSRVFRDTEIEGSPDMTNPFLAPRVSSSFRDSLTTTTTFLESEDETVRVTELQTQEQEDDGERATQAEEARDSSSSTMRSRLAKKKKRSRKSMGK